MYQSPDQFAALNKSQIDTALRFAGVALQGTQRLVALQIEVAKSVLADSVSNVKTLANVKDPQELAGLRSSLVQPNIEKAGAYARNVYSIAAATQSELSKIVESQVEEFNKNVVAVLDKATKNAPAGADFAITAVKSAVAAANATYDNLSKAAKQLAEITEANVAAATQVPVVSKKKAA